MAVCLSERLPREVENCVALTLCLQSGSVVIVEVDEKEAGEKCLAPDRHRERHSITLKQNHHIVVSRTRKTTRNPNYIKR